VYCSTPRSESSSLATGSHNHLPAGKKDVIDSGLAHLLGGDSQHRNARDQKEQVEESQFS
jgi:hypothetical protein